MPQNTAIEVVRMCEDADLKDLVIIMDQVDGEKDLYSPKEINQILKAISSRRKIIETDRKWNEMKSKLGL